MSQNVPIRTTGARWQFLEPAINPEYARTIHGKLKAAGAGLYIIYPKGQALRQKTGGANEWAKDGTAGYTGPVRLLKYPAIVDENGKWQLGATWFAPGPGVTIGETSVDMYWRGVFKCQDIVGSSEVQTETVTATGGTRTLTVTDLDGGTQTTTALAFNANAAAIQAALEALSNVAPGDIVVSGAGPYVYTFGGVYGGRDIPLIVVNTGSLTGGSSSFAQTGPLNTVGRLISGNYTSGLISLGEATPA